LAGTDKTKRDRPRARLAGGPAVVLVDPQLGENIGMVARAMLNCGLGDLRLVRPRDGWPNSAAEKAASGAGEVLDRARLYDSTAAALADLRRIYAATARRRDLIKPLVTPRAAAAELRACAGKGVPAGVIFGPERSGLTSDDVALADAVLEVPLNPAFASLNLAQAVLVVGYEWFQSGAAGPGRRLPVGGTRPATQAEFDNFFGRLEAALERAGFFWPPEKRPGMLRSLRSLVRRLDPTEQDLRTLHGVVSALGGAKRRGSETEEAGGGEDQPGEDQPGEV